MPYFFSAKGASYNLPSNQIRFEIVPQESGLTSSVHAKVRFLSIGEGTKSDSTKTPLVNAEVGLVPLSIMPVIYYPINSRQERKISGQHDFKRLKLA
jgi:hypothetical protein